MIFKSFQNSQPKPLAPSSASLPRTDLIVDSGDLPAAARELRDLFASSGRFFDRGLPVIVIQPANGGLPIAERLTANRIVIEVSPNLSPRQAAG